MIRMPVRPGTNARQMPASPISATERLIAWSAPMRPARIGASGEKSPKQSTGIVTSSPTMAWDTPNELWISGTRGPIPTSCGRYTSAATNRPTSSGKRSPIG